MAVFLLYLLLVPLALPPVFSQGTYNKFKLQHTYTGNTLPNCDNHMNSVLKALNMGCKKCNSIILGDDVYSTDLNNVTNICATGTNKRGNLYESRKKFRIIKCWLTSGFKPPNCEYKKVWLKNIMTKKITVACVNKLPVHFDC